MFGSLWKFLKGNCSWWITCKRCPSLWTNTIHGADNGSQTNLILTPLAPLTWGFLYCTTMGGRLGALGSAHVISRQHGLASDSVSSLTTLSGWHWVWGSFFFFHPVRASPRPSKRACRQDQDRCPLPPFSLQNRPDSDASEAIGERGLSWHSPSKATIILIIT